ncbi:MAG: nitronate monooxygenase, partial [Bacteroidia bacterium]|nr:nitronate monooxygenase [Bacteroidia bacterium]
GREESTTLTLIPQVRAATELPLIAAGGIATGAAMAAVFALGAEGVQMGTRFALTEESSASEEFKQHCIGLNEGDTFLSLKKVSPTRLVKNDFFLQVQELEEQGATADELRVLLGRGRAKKGIFEGDLNEGELEIGQIASHIREILPAGEVVRHIMEEYHQTLQRLSGETFV